MNATAQIEAKPAPKPSFTPVRSNLIQRKCACGGTPGPDGECADCRSTRLALQRRATSQSEPPSVAPVVHEVLRSPGRPLDSEVRAFMEPRFGRALGSGIDQGHQLPGTPRKSKAPLSVGSPDDKYEREAGRMAERVVTSDLREDRSRPTFDFGRVRVHADAKAAESARAVGALAYTVGHDVVFGAGRYAPHSVEGKQLLAHELTHVLQQSASGLAPQVQRVCDPAVLTTRTAPIFFPRQTSIMEVFAGTVTLRTGTTRFAAVGLVQQALVDLGFNLGTSGPNRDGVDRDFGSATEQAVRNFQAAESVGASPGVVDQDTLKCLDETRSHEVVPHHLAATVPQDQLQVGGEISSGRDEDIFFARGSAVPDPADGLKIRRLATAHRGCALELKGFISEDERLEFGAQLATDRLNAVDARFAAEGHDSTGVCTPPPPPAPPLRVLTPMPEASAGVITYRSRRKVEVVPPGATPTTAVCGVGAVRQRPLDAVESPMLTTAITDGVALINTALGHLVAGDPDGDAALNAFFGGVSKRTTVRTKLLIWRNHVSTVIRARNQRGTACDATCSGAIAYNVGIGSSAMMTLCGTFFGTSIGIYPVLNVHQNRALVLVHEAGHGALGTDDVAYDTNRLIHFIAGVPSLALKNTDSFVSLIQCLNGLLGGGCALPARGDTPVGMDATEQRNAQEGIAWLETWLTWAEQDVNGLYSDMNEARTAPRKWSSSYYASAVLDPLTAAFGFRRPLVALPTALEQTAVAAIWERYRSMNSVVGRDLEIEKDTSVGAVQRWEAGPGTRLFITDAYLSLPTPRARVEMLLPLLVEATTSIAAGMRPAYITFVKETVRLNWNNKP